MQGLGNPFWELLIIRLIQGLVIDEINENVLGGRWKF